MGERPLSVVERAAAKLRRTGYSAADRSLLTPESQDAVIENARTAPSFSAPSGELPVFRGPREHSAEHVTLNATSIAEHGLVLPSWQASRTVQEFRALKRELLVKLAHARSTPDKRNRIILVTSAAPGDGKTFISANLALALAHEKDTRVVLVDGDAYRQSVLKSLGISAERGWLDVVAGQLNIWEAVISTNLPNLSLLPAGKERPGIPELMSSRRMKGLLEELVRDDEASIVVIDSAPCLTNPEPSILAGLAGQTLLVVAAHETARDQIETSLRVLQASPGVNLVLNKAHASLAERFRGYPYNYAEKTGD